MSIYNDKKVAIIGLSVEGIDSAMFLSAQGSRITCCDRRNKEELGATYDLLASLGCDFFLGPSYLSALDQFDIIVRSPGISARTQELVAARDNGQMVTSLTGIFMDICPAPIIGVTGTKGKGTTSSLIAEMLKIHGRRVWLGGNVGTPLLSKVHEILNTDIVVLELSSFQLEDLHKSPHIAVVLKITQDHLANFDPLASNFHETREAYVDAKSNIVRFQKQSDSIICNGDDETSAFFSKLTPATPYRCSHSDENADAYIQDDSVYIKTPEGMQKICSQSDIHLLGAHNLENIAAAALAAKSVGTSLESIRRGAKVFEGLEHRLELVRSIGGVSYINDSFSTIPETTIAAIHAFSSPIILIAGGSDKKSDYTELGVQIALSETKELILIGLMAESIKQSALAAGYKGKITEGLTDMHDVVACAAGVAEKGDVVLLSPACASFGMFQNYKERGKQFKHEVSLL